MKNENKFIQILGDNIKYLFHIGIISLKNKFDIKDICRCFTNKSISKQEIEKLSKVFEELKLQSNKSSKQLPSINLNNLRSLIYLKYNDDFTSFNSIELDDISIINKIEYILYQEAEDKYQELCNDINNNKKGKKRWNLIY